jgi:hypothetical protein
MNEKNRKKCGTSKSYPESNVSRLSRQGRSVPFTHSLLLLLFIITIIIINYYY